MSDKEHTIQVKSLPPLLCAPWASLAIPLLAKARPVAAATFEREDAEAARSDEGERKRREMRADIVVVNRLAFFVFVFWDLMESGEGRG